MTRPIRDISASVKQRLLNVAHEPGEEFEQVLVRYVAERFLYRLSKSKHAEAFLLKGAMLFVAWEGMPHRVTRDIDLLGFGDDSLERMTTVMREIAATPVEGDGLVFDVESVQAAEIRTIQDYGGVRVSALASLGKARIRLQVDVGFGDAVTPGPEDIEFPALIDLPRAHLRAYPVATVVAEKALGMVERGLLNSRMKDYFDLLYLSRTRSFDAEGLARALTATASRRKVPIPAGPVAGISAEFATDPVKQAQWQAFCRRLRSGEPVDQLPAVVSALAAFLGAVFEAVADGRHATGNWPPGGPWG
jgi:predicted nucleotidyltransferase component of viral defense system